MREIKFKAKRVGDGEWIYGCYVKYEDTYSVVPDRYSSKPSSCFHIDPNTLCQFTGLCDRNGKEIYEGDIVKHKNPSYENPLEVEWICDYACVGFMDKPDFNTPYFMQKIDEPKLIVIGNIHNK